MSNNPLDFYDGFYSRGGWSYNEDLERATLDMIAGKAGWKQGDRVIEVGAGLCLHAELLRQAGFRVVAVELSPEACERAQQRFPQLQVVCSSVSDYTPDQPGHVFARGMSFYHYELNEVNCKGIDVPAETSKMMEWIPPGGTFVLQIATDLSGRRPPGKVHHNSADEYLRLFTPHGEVHLLDWLGRPVDEGYRYKGVVCVTKRCA